MRVDALRPSIRQRSRNVLLAGTAVGALVLGGCENKERVISTTPTRVEATSPIGDPFTRIALSPTPPSTERALQAGEYTPEQKQAISNDLAIARRLFNPNIVSTDPTVKSVSVTPVQVGTESMVRKETVLTVGGTQPMDLRTTTYQSVTDSTKVAVNVELGVPNDKLKDPKIVSLVSTSIDDDGNTVTSAYPVATRSTLKDYASYLLSPTLTEGLTINNDIQAPKNTNNEKLGPEMPLPYAARWTTFVNGQEVKGTPDNQSIATASTVVTVTSDGRLRVILTGDNPLTNLAR